MKATLVSYYGKKPEHLKAYLSALQKILSTELASAFLPYALDQIHATIIGFEVAPPLNTEIDSLSSKANRFDPAAILNYLRSPDSPCFDIQIGGYVEARDYGFLSQGRHPARRSFSIQNEIAVAMGWPVDGECILDDFRRAFNRYAIQHKWHQSDDDVDNDFYFVVGKISRLAVDEATISGVQQEIRDFMNNSPPLILHVGVETLAVIGYIDRSLPCDSSVVHPVTDNRFTPADFRAYFVNDQEDRSTR